MSLLTICQNVLAETGWPVPNTVSGNTDATARQIFALANRELKALSEMFDWKVLEQEYTFPTVNGTEEYALPSDFRKLAQHSVFDADEYYNLKGSIPRDEWNLRKYGLLGGLSRVRYRLSYSSVGAPKIKLVPTPTGVTDIVMVYYSDDYVINGAATKAQYVIDADEARIPERCVELGLSWRFRRAKGLDYSAELAEYNDTIRQQFAARTDAPDITVGGRRIDHEIAGLTQGYVPDNGFG